MEDWRQISRTKMAVAESSTESIPKSLVTDVLEKAGQLEQEDFHSYVKKTLHKAEEIKVIAQKTTSFEMNSQ